MYYGEHSIRFYPSEELVGTHLFDSSANLDICPDTWKTWRLIPTKKPIFAAPEFEDEMIAIPGRHGLVRLTKGGIGHTVYGNIKGSIEFVPDPDELSHWSGLYSDIRRYLHGKERLAVLRDDRYFFYKGLFRVRNIDPDNYWDKITIEYSLEPFKYERWDGTTEWLWDDFDFECGIARNAGKRVVDGEAISDFNPYRFTVAAGSGQDIQIPYRDFRTPLLVKLDGTGAFATGTNVSVSDGTSSSLITSKGQWFKTIYFPLHDEDNKKRGSNAKTVHITNSTGEEVTVNLAYRGYEL